MKTFPRIKLVNLDSRMKAAQFFYQENVTFNKKQIYF